MEETRHPTHRRYRWWSGMLKGAVAGASPTAPRRTDEPGFEPPTATSASHGAYHLTVHASYSYWCKNCIKKMVDGHGGSALHTACHRGRGDTDRG